MFLEVIAVLSDDGITAELKVSHCRQLHKEWASLSVENLRVRPKDYASWCSYQPRGDDRNAKRLG